MAKAQQQAAIGEVFAGRFRVERRIGRGGMADVFAATDLARKNEVAIKILRSEVAQHEDVQTRFRREGELLRSMRHPSIVAVETFGQADDGRTFLVMELLDGETLADKLTREGRLSIDGLTHLLSTTASALAAAHDAGIIHRDLKPANLFLLRGTSPLVVKILDFGISKVYGTDRITDTGEILGTPRYMAPEQLVGARDLDLRADIYSLGVIAYEALTGVSPFEVSTPSQLILAVMNGQWVPLSERNVNVGRAVAAVVERAMATDRAKRFRSMHELAMAWAAAVAKDKVTPTEPAHATTMALGSLADVPAADPTQDSKRVRPGTFSALTSTMRADDEPPNTSTRASLPDTESDPPRLPVTTPKGLLIVASVVLTALAAIGAVFLLRWLASLM